MALLLLGGCAGTGGEQADDMALGYEEPNDPLETPNRLMFAFNQAVDTTLIKPAAATYRFLLPVEFRDIVRSFLRNLSTPVILANDLLQGNFERAETTMARFVINSSAGAFGLADVAGEMGIEYHREDFGQTLAVHGVDDGFYLVLPIIGPSTARDGVGLVADIFLDPLTYMADSDLLLGRAALTGVDRLRRKLRTMSRNSTGSRKR